MSDRQFLMIGIDTADAVKRAMGYRDGSRCCESCHHFVGDNRGGDPHALRAHCTRNAFGFEVKPAGVCDFWTAKSEGVKS